MPYGYETYRLKNKISPNTIVIEIGTIKSFLTYVNNKYDKEVAPHEIRPIDVKDYLDNERNKGIQDSTVNRKLSYIRTWFNYMWEQGKIPIDFMPKLAYRDKLDITPKSKIIQINYMELLEKKRTVFTNSELSLNTKLFFLFDMRGIRRRDAIKVTTDNIVDETSQITISLETKECYMATFTIDDPAEMAVILQAVEQSVFRNTKYIFSKKDKDRYIPYPYSSLSKSNESIARVIGYPIKSEVLRYAYVHYLYSYLNKNLEEIQKLLGANLSRTALIVKESLVRLKNIDYTIQRTILK